MKIVFMGTPEFAVSTLRVLLASHHHVVAVVTAPDKPRGRGQHISGTPVKVLAEEHGITCIQPVSLKDEAFQMQLRALHADLFVVVAFRILPVSVFTIPPRGTINLHASLLPKYRGAAPINWALIRGEKETGVTTFFIEETVDTGEVLLQSAVPITDTMTAGELHDVLASIGAGVVLETVNGIEAETLVPIHQDNALASPASKLTREICRIDWSKSAHEVHNFIRGLSPHPGAWTMHGNSIMKILRSNVAKDIAAESGVILSMQSRLFVACGSGAIEILEIQQEGRKAMKTDAFLRGYRFTTLSRFD